MGGATERAQALLDPLSANSDCASAFKDEKEEEREQAGKAGMEWDGTRSGRIKHRQVCTKRASITSRARGNNADHA